MKQQMNSTNEQLTLCVRYLDTQNHLCEDFLQFIKVDSLTGTSLSSAIINSLYIILKMI